MKHKPKHPKLRRPRPPDQPPAVNMDGTTISPKDNPYLGTDNVYQRMGWDQDHGFADYS